MGRKIFSYHGALIDMDGVLYDSMRLHTLAWKQMMDSQGIKSTREEFYLYEGMTGKDTIRMIFDREKGIGISDQEAERLYKIKSDLFIAMGGAEVMPGAVKMVEQLGRLGFLRVLVTGSSQHSILDKLNIDYPDVFITGRRVTADDVEHGKPHPEPYLKGAALAGIPPQQCIVIENAPLGVRAGKAAGCRVIAVTTGPIPRSKFVEEGADMIFDSMENFADFLEYCTDSAQLFGWQTELEWRLNQLKDVDKVIILTDDNVCQILKSKADFPYQIITVPAGEQSKNMNSVTDLLSEFYKSGVSRNSVLVNIGGGMITDLGGLVAGLYMRGIRHINIPTTAMGMADAAIGGKTAVNFNNVKNLVGLFKMPEYVITDTDWLNTLSSKDLISGFAEVIKSALLSSVDWYQSLLNLPSPPTAIELRNDYMRAARFKESIVSGDPYDHKLRRILNLGHTAGHAVEALSDQRGVPMSHGNAVAFGIYVALLLSHKLCGLDFRRVAEYRDMILKKFFVPVHYSVKDIDALMELMATDKKNLRHGDVSMVLLSDIGQPLQSVTVDSQTLRSALRVD